MVEIRRAPAIAANSDLSQRLAGFDELIDQLSPRAATAYWDVVAQDRPGEVYLRISDAYGKSSRTLSEIDLSDADRMLAKVSRLVGDLVYQQCENLRDPGTLAHLASFAPGRLCERFAGPQPEIPLPSAEDTSCAVLFADISGFTSLTERLARKGAVGAEELTSALNRYFGDLIDIVMEFGGDVLKFAGDALLATFEDRMNGANLQDAAGRAAAASLMIQSHLRDFPDVEGTKLSLKIALAAGDLRMLHIGGVFGRCELLMVGDALKELGDANDLAGPGDIIAADSFYSRIESLLKTTPLQDGNVQVEGLTRDVSQFETVHESGQETLVDAPFRVSSVAAMRGYIPAAIYSRLAAGHTDWLGELRQITVVFANLPGFNRETPLEDAQRVMATLQQTIYRFEGSLNKMSVDDKGVSMLAGFGLPPVTHEDDEARAVGAALTLKEAMTKIGWDCSIGVATGRVFCGAYGNDDRREYTMIGDTVNTSARLMQAAKGGILCDSGTYHRSEERFDFETLEPLVMKGKSQPVPCFRPLERRSTTRQRSDQNITVIARDDERLHFEGMLDDLLDRQQSSLLLLEGEAGVGKSHLINAFCQQADQRGCHVLNGAGDAIERSTPWFVWRSVFADIIGPEDLSRKPESLADVLTDRFELDDNLQKLIPLLSPVLPQSWPDNEWTAQMNGATRAGNTNRLLMRLFSHAVQSVPTVLALEDTHYFDSASLNLLRSLATVARPLTIIAAARPLIRPLHKDAAAIVGMSTSKHVQLEPLDGNQAVCMTAHLLEVDQLPRAVDQLIRNRTQGLPLYIDELAHALRDTHTIEVDSGKVRVTGDLEQFETRDVSDSLERVIVNRIDRLQPSEQLAIKVASVIGYEFSGPVLRDVFPIEQERNELPQHLASLGKRRLIRCFEDRPEAEHSFRNRLTRDVAYNLVLVKHRSELHAAIAKWIENQHSGELDGYYPRLANHWKRAGENLRAIECLERAGTSALENNANQEAQRFFRDAIDLAEHVDEPVDPSRRGSWHRRYAEALYRLGDMTESMRHFRAALKLYGYSDRESVLGQVTAGNFELVRQVFTRIRTSLLGKRKPKPDDDLLEATRAYERLVEIQYQRADLPAFLLVTFRSLNLAERYGLCDELPRCYSNVSAMVSAMMLPRSAERYIDRARQTAEKARNLSTTAYCGTVNAVYYIGRGLWDQGRASLDPAIEASQSVGDRRRLVESAVMSVNMCAWSGDWGRIPELLKHLDDVVEHEQITQVATWCYAWRLWLETARDPHSELVHQTESSQADWLDTDEPFTIADGVLSHGGVLFGPLRRREWDEAIRIADRIEAAIGKAQPFPIYVLPSYSALVDLYYILQKHNLTPGDSTAESLKRRLQVMRRRLSLFSLMNPIARPLKCLADGYSHLLAGRTARARRAFRKGLASAERYPTPYFSGRLARELAQLAESSTESEELLQKANEYFCGLGIENPDIVCP